MKKLPKVATMPLDENRPFLEQLEEAAIAESEDACVWLAEKVIKASSPLPDQGGEK